ncbi:hypothetical protein Taro_019269 [Colocasia esculenta]|uniref:Uncharacterized protein n=1 Tax=Colocasia esculenta TaxID=4460 RepID=A0A843USZ8_COLES|nr:hypothetical protein [Colocasia esculenta]
MYTACGALGGMLTSTLRRRRPTLLRSARDGGVRRILNCTQFITQVIQIELSTLCLARGRSCCGDLGRFGISEWFSERSRHEDIAWSGGDAVSWVVCVFFAKRLFRNTSLVGYPRFCVSQARVFVVLGVCPGTLYIVEVCVVFLDTLTHVFELYVWLRERWQRGSDLELRPESLEVPGMGLQLCGLQVWCWLVSTVLWFVLVERQLDLSSVTARLRGGTVVLRLCGGGVVELCSVEVV